jgi:hypothetical protein
MNSYLEMLQNADFAAWVRVAWGYPFLLILHSLGFGLLVGILIVIDLRIIGFMPTIPLLPLKRLMTLVWGGFILNLITGAILFSADAVKFYHSPAFRIKISSILIGVALAAVMTSSVLKVGDKYDQQGAQMPLLPKLLAGLSILVWLNGISFGRYMAYE